MIKTTLALALLATALSGCVAAYDVNDGRPNRAYYNDRDVTIRYEDRDRYDRAYWDRHDRWDRCPPGHRKKNWC